MTCSYSSNILLGVTNINWNFLERLGAPRDASNVVSLASFFRTLRHGIDSMNVLFLGR